VPIGPELPTCPSPIVCRPSAGVVKGKLGSKLYVNLADDVGTEAFTDGIKRLVQELATLVGREFVPLATGSKLAEVASVCDVHLPAAPETAGTDDSELPVARAALELLLVLATEEPLRLALQAAAPLELLESIVERSPTDRPTALLLLACVHAPRLELAEGPDAIGADNSKERVLTLLDRFAMEEEVLRALTEAMRVMRWGPEFFSEQLGTLRQNLAAVRGLASSSSRAAKLVDAGVPSKLRQLLLEGMLGAEKATLLDLATAADALCRCAYSSGLRAKLKVAGVESALHTVLAGLPTDDDSDGAGRLRQATKQALTALAGELDATPSKKEMSLMWINQLSAADADWSDTRLLELPCFTAFIGHKRASSQDFARSLHSIIIGAGYSCFLDVVRASRALRASLASLACEISAMLAGFVHALCEQWSCRRTSIESTNCL
jgi:hypothetical protein